MAKRPPSTAIAGVVVLVLAVGAFVLVYQPGPADAPVRTVVSTTTPTTPAEPAVIAPANLERLDPQLRQHITEALEQARAAPSDPVQHARLGLIYAANGLWPEAQACFAKTVQLDPLNVLAGYHLAVALQETDRHAEALARLRQLTADHPDFAPAQHRLGDLLLETGAVDEAAAAFERAIELAPNAAEPHAGLGIVKLRTNDAAGAAIELERAVQLDPGYRLAHYQLGLAYRSLGRSADAERELGLGQDSWKQFMPDAWSDQMVLHATSLKDQVDRAKLLFDKGRLDDALAVLEEALKWHPDDVRVYTNIALIHLARQDFVAAESALMKAAERDDGRFGTFVNLSACKLHLGEMDEALRCANRAVELAPEEPKAHLARYQVLYSSDPEKALESLTEAVRLDASNAALAMTLANQFLVLDKVAQARIVYIETIRRDPNLVQAYLGLCETCARLGLIDEAIAALQAAEKIGPDNESVAKAAARLQAAIDQQSQSTPE